MEPPIATENLVELESGETLKVFSIKEDFYISQPEGLKVINAPLNWLDETHTTNRIIRSLREFGFTGETKTIIYKNKIGFFQAEVRTFIEWLSIWALFANRKNAKAAKLLRLLALKSLKERIANSRKKQTIP